MNVTVGATKALLVTVRDYPGKDWADVARTIHRAWQLWQSHQHKVVFADFGDLGDGVPGIRFARSLRQRSVRTRIFLLSDAPDTAQRVWARVNGANDVIQRNASVIAACMSEIAEAKTAFNQDVAMVVDDKIELAMRVMPALLAHGGDCITAGNVVRDAIEELTQAKDGALPGLEELASYVARDIGAASARLSFLRCFAIAKPPLANIDPMCPR